MGIEAIIATLVGVAGVLGGYFGGKRNARSQSMADEVNTVALLQGAIAELERQNKVKDVLIADLSGRIATLENLVTQRADVEAVKKEVMGVRDVVDRIAQEVCRA